MIKDNSSCEYDSQLPSNQVNVNNYTSQEIAQSQVQLSVHKSVHKSEIVHATNGRLRIRATDGDFNANLQTISEYLRQYKGLKEVCFHQQTGSLVLTLDENLLSMSELLNILEQFDIQQTPISNTDSFPRWKSLDFWQKQSVSLIPLLTGLAMTGRLGISGFTAIPVYMITAHATRRVISYMEPKLSRSNVKKVSQTSVSKNDLCDYLQANYSIVHAIPGRIRFHVPLILQHKAYGEQLEKLLKANPQVVSVRVNYHAGSVAITYQPNQVSVSHGLI